METVLQILSVATILLAPFVSNLFTNPWFWLNSSLIRLLLVLFIAYAVRFDGFTGLLAFLAVFSLFVERNHTLLTRFPSQKPIWPNDTPSKAIPSPISTEHIEVSHYEPPHPEEVGQSVVERHGDTTTEELYESAADIGDSNPRVDSVPQGEAAARLYEFKGLV